MFPPGNGSYCVNGRNVLVGSKQGDVHFRRLLLWPRVSRQGHHARCVILSSGRLFQEGEISSCRPAGFPVKVISLTNHLDVLWHDSWLLIVSFVTEHDEIFRIYASRA